MLVLKENTIIRKQAARKNMKESGLSITSLNSVLLFWDKNNKLIFANTGQLLLHYTITKIYVQDGHIHGRASVPEKRSAREYCKVFSFLDANVSIGKGLRPLNL